MSRHAKLADYEYVHRRPKCPRDFVRDWNATPREGQYHQVVSADELMQLTGENCSGVPSIGKA